MLFSAETEDEIVTYCALEIENVPDITNGLLLGMMWPKT